jgi:DNA-binding LacI/PurR family transcriptional regulator/signal transduction histidine kinase
MPPRIGLLIDFLVETYQLTVLSGVADEVREQGANLVCFVGGYLCSPETPGFEFQRNIAYELAGLENVDGLVMASGVMAKVIGPAAFKRFAERYRPLPIVHIALPVEGMCSVLVDNPAGLRAALTHLIEGHGYRRIAFIRGTAGNLEAEERFRVYTDVLAAYGVPFDPSLVAPGDFTMSTGRAAMRLLLDERRTRFEAVVAANDNMALGVVEALRDRGRRVPEDVAVIGFDDIPETRFATPPLTTVRQPLYEQGRRAAQLVLGALRGEGLPEQVSLPTELVPRRSCGCPVSSRAISRQSEAAQQRDFLHQNLRSEREARVLLGEISHLLMGASNLTQQMEMMAQDLPRLGITSCYISLYEGEATFPSEWSRLILAYDETGRLDRDSETGGQRFLTRRLFPEELAPRHQPQAFVVEPLYYEGLPLGFAVLKLVPGVAIYGTLCGQLSGVLKAALMAQQLAERNIELEKRTHELEGAYAALQDNQKKLLMAEKLATLGWLTAGIAHEMHTPLAAVRTALADLTKLTHEYEISLGDPGMTPEDYREIAQEMHRSLQLAQKAAEQAVGFVRSVKAQTRDLAPQEHLLFEVAPVIRDSLLLLSHALRRGKCTVIFEVEAEKVQLYGSPGRLAQIVTNLVVNAIDASAVENRRGTPEDLLSPPGDSPPEKKGGASGQIKLCLTTATDAVILQVSDQGSGIPPETLPKIFDPMFTTKPFGQGTGLGLTIVHDIVTGDFGGTIEATSQLGQGTTFILHFPLLKPSPKP